MAQARGVSRVLAKLEKSISEGKYYEAHQMYRTLNFRYLNQKKYDELLELLYKGSTLLLNHSQQSSGADLAMLLLEAQTVSKAPPSEQHVGRCVALFRLLDAQTRPPFLVKAVGWSSSEQHKQGHPLLHQRLAKLLWEEKDYGSARYHFLRSEDGSGCATLLIELHLSKGYPSEVDLFLTQAVLQYLCLQKRVVAVQVFEVYTHQHPAISQGPPYLLPLLNFLWFLLLATERGRVPEFTVLCEQYAGVLARDPCYKTYLDTIGQLFFQLPPPPRRQNMFGNILQSILGGLEEEEEEAAPLTTEELD